VAADSTPIYTDAGCLPCSGIDPWDPCDYYRFYLTIGAQNVAVTQTACVYSGVLVFTLWVQRYTASDCATPTGDPVNMGPVDGTLYLQCAELSPTVWALSAAYSGMAGSASAALGTKSFSDCPDGTYSDGSVVS
jgi:hypothetical protein